MISLETAADRLSDAAFHYVASCLRCLTGGPAGPSPSELNERTRLYAAHLAAAREYAAALDRQKKRKRK